MEIKFTFRLDPPRSWVRTSVFAGALAAVLGTGVALVQADVTLTTFTTGTPIKSADVNVNFAALAAAVGSAQTPTNRIVVTYPGGVKSSLGAVYRATSPTPVTGAIVDANTSTSGYVATKKICEAATSSSGHMCTSEELLRSQYLGITAPTGWYSTGVNSASFSAPVEFCDCRGWNDATSDANGAGWSASPSGQGCNMPLPILCCD